MTHTEFPAVRTLTPTREWLRSILIVASATVLVIASGCDRGEAASSPSEPPGLPDPAEPAAPAEPAERPAPPEGAAQAALEAERPAEAASISDAELDSFVDVQTKLGPLQERIGEEAKAGADQGVLQAKFQAEATEIVSDSDLSPERFNELGLLVQRDPEVQRRFQSALERRMAEEAAARP